MLNPSLTPFVERLYEREGIEIEPQQMPLLLQSSLERKIRNFLGGQSELGDSHIDGLPLLGSAGPV